MGPDLEDLDGCSDIIYSNVIINPSPNLSLNPSTASICQGAILQIEVFGASSYVWSPNLGLNTIIGNIPIHITAFDIMIVYAFKSREV